MTVLWHSLVKWLSLSIIILQSCSGNILFCRHSTCVFIDKIPVSCTVSCITAYRSSAHFLRALSCDIRTWARDEWESRWVSTKGTNEITLLISSRISECWLQLLFNCSGMLLHAEIFNFDDQSGMFFVYVYGYTVLIERVYPSIYYLD